MAGWDDLGYKPLAQQAPAPASSWDALGYPPVAAAPRAPQGFVESVQAGAQGSVLGLAWRQKLPELVMSPEHSKWWERLATGVTQVAMDLPIMIPAGMKGGALGAAGGGAVGGPPGALVGGLTVGGAAMFAAPAAIRTSLIEAYKARDAETPADWWNILREVATATATEGAVGAVTLGAGGMAARVTGRALAPALGSSLAVPAQQAGRKAIEAGSGLALVTGTADVAAQIAAMVTMPALLHGQLPAAMDFVDAAAVILTLKGAHMAVDRTMQARTANRMADTYAKTGKTPAEQLADAQADARIAEDLTREATGTSSGVPIKLDRLIAEAMRLADPLDPPDVRSLIRQTAEEGRLPPQQGATKLDALVRSAEQDWQITEAPNIRALIDEIKKEGPIQESLFPVRERLEELEIAAKGTPEKIVQGPDGPVAMPGEASRFLTDAERQELAVLRELVPALEARIKAGEVDPQALDAPPVYTSDQMRMAQDMALDRLLALFNKSMRFNEGGLTNAERAERAMLKDNLGNPEGLARHFRIDPVVPAGITREAHEASAQRIYDDVLQQVRAADDARIASGLAPLGEDHALAVAALVRARARTRAARLGVLPEDLYRDRPLQIRDEAAAEVAAAEAAIPADAPRYEVPEIDLFGNPIEAPMVPRLAVEGLATVEVPLMHLVLSKEVPQFKNAADAEGVVVPLGGTFDRTGVGPIQVWERLDGTLEVISGRHRLDLARRSGEETIPAQIHREADGFGAREAATLDAQLNIREEQGSVADYAQYFKDSGITKEAADERGLLARAKGRSGFAIARDASPELLAAHRASLLSDEAALSISSAAPGSERLQALGISMVADGKSILIAVNTMKAVDLMAAERGVVPDTGDMFGFDESAMLEASTMAKKASSQQRMISEQIAAVAGASKRPELAAKMGVNVSDPEAIRLKIVELRQEQYLWDNWPLHPELVARLRELNQAPITTEDALSRRIEELERLVDEAYERNDPNVEKLDAELADLRERVGDQQREPEDYAFSTVEEQMIGAYLRWRDETNGMSKSDAIDLMRAIVRDNRGTPAPDAELIAAAKDAYDARAERIARFARPGEFELKPETPAELAARNVEAAAQAKRKLAQEAAADRGERATFDQADLFNTQGTLFQTRASRPIPPSIDDITSLKHAHEIAGRQAWATNRDFKVAMQEETLAAARAAGVDLHVDNPNTRAYIARQLVKEATDALRTNANAVGWYDGRVTTALEIAAEIHPEIATDPRAQFAFKWALAATSNGLPVEKNFELAFDAYAYQKKTGKFPEDIGIGASSNAINKALATYNKLIDKWGFDKFHEFATTLQPNRNLKAAFGRAASGEGMDTMVYGAAIIGPKIGNGFFMNLYGKFAQLTMDRWWTRMWGRLTGELVKVDRAAAAESRTNLVEIIDYISTHPEARKAIERALGRRLAKSSPVEVAEAISSKSEKPAFRELLATILPEETHEAVIAGIRGKVKDYRSGGDELRKAAQNLVRQLDGQIEDPGNSTRRNMMRGVTADAMSRLLEEHPDLTVADFQALMWFPEKTLYDTAGLKEGSKEGYNDAEAPDYANAAANLARRRGISEDRIQAAVARADAAVAQRRAAASGRGSGELPGPDRTGPRRDSALPEPFYESGLTPEGDTLYQPVRALGGLDNRGSYRIAENLITTMRGADKSTVVHELSHSWLEEVKADAQRPGAPAQLKADWEVLRRELAIPESGEISRASHEQFARTSERYLGEGEAPSVELRGVFQRFRDWLLEIYNELRNLNVEINPEMRDVLDRMLATDEEIAAARQLNVPRAYVGEAAATEARKIVPGFKAEQVSMEPYADELPRGPGEAPDNSHVNYAYINTPLDVKLTMQRMAEIDQENIQRQRGGTDGVKSWADANAEQARYVNEILGGSEDTLKILSPRDPDAPGPDVRLGILKKLAIGAAKDSARLRDIVLEAGHDATVRQQLEYMGSIERARMIQAEFLGERASVARALNALKDVTEGTGEIGRMLDAIGYGEEAARTLYQGRTPGEEQAILKAKLDEILMNYRGKSVLDIARLHKEIGTLKGTFKMAKALEKATTWEMVVEGWKSSLLSGPVTHTTNLFGTGAFQALRAPVDALASIIGMSRGASPGMGESDRASMSEALARITGMLGGVQDGMKAAYHTFKADDPTGKTESYRTAIPGPAGDIIRIPLRLMGAEDALVSTMYRRGEMKTLAIRQAFDEQLNPSTREFAERVDYLMDHPTPEMDKTADAAATRMTFNMPLGEKGVALQLFVAKWNLQWMIPFIRTPINVTKEVARMSPFAPLVGEWRADMAQGGVARDRAIAEVAVGSGIMALTMALTFAGQVSGSGSPDPGKNRGKAGVWQPNSVLIGDTWYEISRIQPTGTLMTMAADLAEVWDHMTDEEKDKVPKMLARAFANAVTNQTFLQGITNVINAMSDPTRFAPKFLQQLAGSMVPNIIAQPTAMTDPVVREVNSALEAIQARIPGMRQDLLPKRDWLGAEMESKGRIAGVLPVRMQPVSEDKVRLEAARLDISMSAAPKKTHIGKGTGKLGDVELTPEERDAFAKAGGEMAHRILTNVVNAQGWDAMPDVIKRKVYSNVLTASHQFAAAMALPLEKRMSYLQQITEKMTAELSPK